MTPVTLLLPNNLSGVIARRHLALSGIAGLYLGTLGRLAEQLAAGALSPRRPATRPIVAATWRTALSKAPGIFQEVAEHPSTIQALASAHRELRDLTDPALDKVTGASALGPDLVRLHRHVTHRARAPSGTTRPTSSGPRPRGSPPTPGRRRRARRAGPLSPAGADPDRGGLRRGARQRRGRPHGDRGPDRRTACRPRRPPFAGTDRHRPATVDLEELPGRDRGAERVRRRRRGPLRRPRCRRVPGAHPGPSHRRAVLGRRRRTRGCCTSTSPPPGSRSTDQAPGRSTNARSPGPCSRYWRSSTTICRVPTCSARWRMRRPATSPASGSRCRSGSGCPASPGWSGVTTGITRLARYAESERRTADQEEAAEDPRPAAIRRAQYNAANAERLHAFASELRRRLEARSPYWQTWSELADWRAAAVPRSARRLLVACRSRSSTRRSRSRAR